MKILRTILVACGLASIVACGDMVTPVAPAGPRYDSDGFPGGPEGRAAGENQADTAVVEPYTEETAGGTTTERGTMTVGSGG